MTSTNFAAGAYAASQNFLQGGTGGSAGTAKAGIGAGFEAMLSGALTNATEAGHGTEAKMAAAAAGKGDLVDVVTAVAETETALQTMVAVRDRVIAAYEELMRMQI